MMINTLRKRSLFFWAVVVLVLAGLAVWFEMRSRLVPAERLSGHYVTVAGKDLKVELADTPAKQEQGLSGRKSLCEDCGMLFIFDNSGIYPFWMKSMFFNIDILWIKDNQVVDVTLDARKPGKDDFDNPDSTYQSKVLVDKVLEVNSGWVMKNQVKVGDEVIFR